MINNSLIHWLVVGKILHTKSGKICKVDCLVLFITTTNTGLITFYDMEPNTLIHALNEFIVIISKKYTKL